MSQTLTAHANPAQESHDVIISQYKPVTFQLLRKMFKHHEEFWINNVDRFRQILTANSEALSLSDLSGCVCSYRIPQTDQTFRKKQWLN